MIRSYFFTICLSAMVLNGRLEAQFTWTGAVDGNWGNADNWDTQMVPLTGASVTFSGSTTTNVDLNGDRTVADLSFNAAAPFSLGNSTLNLSGTVSTEGTSGGEHLLDSTVNLLANTLWDISPTAPLTVHGQIFGGGGLMKSGEGSLTLSSANLFIGPTEVVAGQLVLDNPFALQNSVVYLVANQGLEVTTHSVNALLGGLRGSGNLDLGSQDIAVGLRSGSHTYSGNLSGSGTLVKVGPSTQALTGYNTHSETRVEGGTLSFFSAASLGDEDADLELSVNSLLQPLASIVVPIGRNLVLGAGGGTINTNGQDLRWEGLVRGGGQLTKTGQGTLTIADTSSHSNAGHFGATTVKQGELTIDGSEYFSTGTTIDPTGNLNVHSGTFHAGYHEAGLFSNPGGNLTNFGTLIIDNGGKLIADGGGSISAINGYTISSSNQLQLIGGTIESAGDMGAITLAVPGGPSHGLQGGAGGTLEITGGTANLNGIVNLPGGPGGDGIAGTVSIDPGFGGEGGTGGTLHVSSGVATLGVGGKFLAPGGAGGMGTNENSHGELGSSGTLQVSDTGQLVINGGVVDLASRAGADKQQGGTVSVDGGQLVLTSGSITAHTFSRAATGSYQQSGGALSVDTINNDPSGTFDFTGGTMRVETFNGSLTQNGGTLAPRELIGTMQIVGDYTLDSGIVGISLGGTGNSHTMIEVTGDIDISSSDTSLELQLLGPMSAGTYTLLQSTNGAISGAFQHVTDLGIYDDLIGIQYTDSEVTLTLDHDILGGDFSLDGDVDGGDFLQWQRGDSLVADGSAGLYGWETTFGSHIDPFATTHSVPEPASVLLAVFTAFLFMQINYDHQGMKP